MMATAKGFCMAEPAPIPSASGINASTAMIDDISIGRMRSFPASIGSPKEPSLCLSSEK